MSSTRSTVSSEYSEDDDDHLVAGRGAGALQQQLLKIPCKFSDQSVDCQISAA
jgi:hypothetical protein